MLPEKGAKEGSSGSAYKVREHEYSIVTAADLVTKCLNPGHVGYLPTLIAKIKNYYTDN